MNCGRYKPRKGFNKRFACKRSHEGYCWPIWLKDGGLAQVLCNRSHKYAVPLRHLSMPKLSRNSPRYQSRKGQDRGAVDFRANRPLVDCRFFKRANIWICGKHDVYAFQHSVTGGFAKFMRYPKESIDHQVPKDLRLGKAILVEPVACSL